MEKKISIIIPAFNEEDDIAKTLSEMRSFFKNVNYEIIVSADGCTDRTADIVTEISKKDHRINLLNTKERLGKGGGIKKGFYASNGDVVVFADADRSCSSAEISRLVGFLKDYDIVIASRAIDRGKIVKRQSFVRDYMGRTFNFLLKLLLGLKINDTQCGYKAFRRNVLLRLLPNVKSNGWEFDAELLYKATKAKYNIYECAVVWKNRDESKFKIFPDSLKMLLGLIRIRLNN